jgi:lysyl-tRNA synthetase class 1
VLNFSVLRYNPDRHIDYDPGLGILDVVDEYDHIESLYFNGGADEKEKDLLRAYEIAQPKSVRTRLPMQVPYRHLVHVVQTAETFEGVLTIINRTEGLMPPAPEDIEVLRERCDCVRYWLDNFAPDEVKFAIAKEMPAVELSAQEKTYLSVLHKALTEAAWDPDTIHNAVYDNAKVAGILPKVAFQALYKIFVSRTSGPRLGYFLSTLDREFVMKRLAEASA